MTKNIHQKKTKFKKDLTKFLGAIDIKNKDVFLHVKLKNLKLNYHLTYNQLSKVIIESLNEKKVSNIITPSFTYSFINKKKFNLKKSKSEAGLFSEIFRQNYSSYRTNDPIYSVCLQKNLDVKLKKNFDFNSSFKKNTIWQYLFKPETIIINIGLDHLIISLIHYIEYINSVPYRKIFKRHGKKIINGKYNTLIYNLYGRKDLNKYELDWNKIENFLLEKNFLFKKDQFKGCLVKIYDAGKEIKKQLKKNPFFLLKNLNC